MSSCSARPFSLPDGTVIQLPVLETANVRNQILTFLIAGQLTTSELMPNALFNIVSDPAVLHRVQAEVDAVFGTDDDYLPEYDDIVSIYRRHGSWQVHYTVTGDANSANSSQGETSPLATGLIQPFTAEEFAKVINHMV